MKVAAVLSIVGLVIFSALLTGSKLQNKETTVTTVPKITLEAKAPVNLPFVNNDSKELTRLDLRDKNVVLITGPIGSEAADKAKEILEFGDTGQPVYLLLDSPGGSVIDGALVLSAIQASKVPVYTVCLSLCASMAYIIHQYGTERYMVDRSVLMAHPASGGLQGTLQQMQSRLGMISSYVEKMNVFIAKRNGLDINIYNQLTVSEFWLDAEDSLQRGFTEKIVSVLYNTPKSSGFFFLPQELTPEDIKQKINLR